MVNLKELRAALDEKKPKKSKTCMRFSETSYNRLLRISEITGETTSRVLNELLKDFLFNDIAELAFDIKAVFESHKNDPRRQAIIYLDADVARALDTKSRRMLLQPKMIREYVIEMLWQEVSADVSAMGK